MARPYTINIVNGEGSQRVISGSYNVTSLTNGYSDETINPSTIQVDKSTGNYIFTIAATGTLTLHVTETGTAEGTPIIGASFNRCDSEGNTYGDAIVTDTNGDAIFNNVPFSTTDAPLIYYKQTASDDDHEFDDALANTTMTTSSSTLEIVNTLALLRTISLTDTNYNGLPIESAQITLN